VVLVAMGLWTDGSRKRRILDWEIAEKEEQAAWERLVQRLWERGVKLETGLQAIVRDRSEGLEQALDYVYGSALVQQPCIFHKLRNVSDKCPRGASPARGIWGAVEADSASGRRHL
jgi:transposase-like protein